MRLMTGEEAVAAAAAGSTDELLSGWLVEVLLVYWAEGEQWRYRKTTIICTIDDANMAETGVVVTPRAR